jgi:CBS domain containing-hemolysin-like protein
MTPGEILAHVAVIVACLALSGFFSSSETALMRLRPEQIVGRKGESRRGDPAGFAIRDLLRSTSRLLVTILLGNNVVNILGAAVATGLAVAYLGEGAGVIVATLVMTLLVLVFAEVLPKAYAARYPEQLSRRIALPLYLFHQAMTPLHRLVDRALDPVIARIAGGAEFEQLDGHDERSGVVERVLRLSSAGAKARTALSIIGATAQAEGRTVEEIMVQRPEIDAYPLETPPAELAEHVVASRHTRVPLYRDSIDQIVGLVHVKDIVRAASEESPSLESILRPVLFVSGRKHILDLLRTMQQSLTHMAIVQDEFGVTQGLVTQEDILEELVGEIRDEFDRDELLSIRACPEGGWDALGRLRVADFNRQTDSAVPGEPGDTLSGLVFHGLGRVPRAGETVKVPGYSIRVLEVAGRRVRWVRIQTQTEATDSDAAAEASAAG